MITMVASIKIPGGYSQNFLR